MKDSRPAPRDCRPAFARALQLGPIGLGVAVRLKDERLSRDDVEDAGDGVGG